MSRRPRLVQISIVKREALLHNRWQLSPTPDIRIQIK